MRAAGTAAGGAAVDGDGRGGDVSYRGRWRGARPHLASFRLLSKVAGRGGEGREGVGAGTTVVVEGVEVAAVVASCNRQR